MPVSPMPVSPIVPHVTEKGYRWFKQNRGGGLQEMLKIRQATGNSQVIPSAVIAGS